MKRTMSVACGLVCLLVANAAQARIGASVSVDGAAPNDNTMLGLQSPATGAGKGLLISRITANQRTNASAALTGGLLDNAGHLRGGGAQGLIVYQTDGTQGFATTPARRPRRLGRLSGAVISWRMVQCP